jgi:hypothetical protein
VETGEETIDMSGLPPSVYILKLTANAKTTAAKLVITR